MREEGGKGSVAGACVISAVTEVNMKVRAALGGRGSDSYLVVRVCDVVLEHIHACPYIGHTNNITCQPKCSHPLVTESHGAIYSLRPL